MYNKSLHSITQTKIGYYFTKLRKQAYVPYLKKNKNENKRKKERRELKEGVRENGGKEGMGK